MPKNWHEVGLWTPQESWRAIRNIRAALPQAVATVAVGDRADVFHMALEQSEQLFRSASSVERETRPILLFYGLGQAGRALAAASKRLSRAEWQASGHGLKTHLDEVRSTDIWDLRTSVTPQKSDLFRRASLALDSATDLTSVRLGEAAANVVEFIQEFPEFRQYPRLVRPATVTALNSWYSTEQRENLRFPIGTEAGEDPDKLLASVPSLSGYGICREEDGTPSRDHNGNLLISVPATAIEIVGGSAHLRNRQNYRGHDIAVRALGGASRPIHPLLVWWLVLYPLSMLARYEPRKWQQVLDVRASTSWSQIEYLTDRALDAVPQLLAEALRTLNQGT